MRASDADRQRFVELVEAHQGILHRICSVYGRGVEEQRDLFQEIVLQLWRSHASFRGQSSFTTWMSAFCIVVWVEDQEGGYRIGRVPQFTALSMGMIFGTYVLMRLGHYPMVRRSLAALQDLESQIAEQTERVQSLHKYWVVGAALVFIALAVTVAWTFRMLLSATN